MGSRTFPGCLGIAGSCSQGETQAKEGWRPSCLPSLLHHLGARGRCALYLLLHRFPLLSPGRRYHPWDLTSNWLATLAGDHAPPALETSARPLVPNQTARHTTPRLPQLQSPLGPLTRYDTWPPLLTIDGPSVVETTACRGGAKCLLESGRTTRDETKTRKGRRAQNRRLSDTNVRNPVQQAPRTRARQELVSRPFKQRTALPVRPSSRTLFRSTFLHHLLAMHACIHFVRALLCTLCKMLTV